VWTPALERSDVCVTVLNISILIMYAPTGLLCGRSQAKYTTKSYIISFQKKEKKKKREAVPYKTIK
jgi:hypothetical protein